MKTAPDKHPASHSRRTVLKGAALVGTGAVLGMGAGRWILPAPPAPRAASNPSLRLPFTLYTTGREGRRLEGVPSQSNMSSVVTSLDMNTLEMRQSTVPTFNAHLIFPLVSRDMLVVVSQKLNQSSITDADLRFKRTINAPANHHFSGHGVVLEEKGAVLISGYHETNGTGIILLYDIDTMQEVERYASQGLRPHDTILYDANTIALAHAGIFSDRAYPQAGAVPASGRYGDVSPADVSKITLLTLDNFTVSKDYIIPVDYPALHLSCDASGDLFAVVQSFLPPGMQPHQGSFGSDYDAYLSARNFPLHTLEGRIDGDGVALPLPLIRFDKDTGKASQIFTKPEFQRRSQSVVYHPAADTVFATYVFSDRILAIRADGSYESLDTRPLGISGPIGLCAIPSTPYLAIGGIYDDIAIVDAASFELVARMDLPLFRSSHISLHAHS